jgi:hypothetical protein
MMSHPAMLSKLAISSATRSAVTGSTRLEAKKQRRRESHRDGECDYPPIRRRIKPRRNASPGHQAAQHHVAQHDIVFDKQDSHEKGLPRWACIDSTRIHLWNRSVSGQSKRASAFVDE